MNQARTAADSLESFAQVLSQSLLTECEFANVINSALGRAAEAGIRIGIIIRESELEIAKYGSFPQGAGGQTQQNETWAPIRCEYFYSSTRGNTPQDLADVTQAWEKISEPLLRVLEEHWRAREPHSALWTGQDDSVRTKAKQTIAESASKKVLVSYVRLDCDGFGAAKDRLGGEQQANEVMHSVATFFRTKLQPHCLVFHPHGDEFTLIFVGTSAEEVIDILAKFQDQMTAQDFRPAGAADPINLGVRMVIAFSTPTLTEEQSAVELERLRTQAEGVDIKHRQDRGFIEIASPNPTPGGTLQRDHLEEAVLRSFVALEAPTVRIFPDALQNFLAQQLVIHDEGTGNLSDQLRKLLTRFCVRVATRDCLLSPVVPIMPATSFLHPSTLVAIMMHTVLKRTFEGRGSCTAQSRIRLVVRQNQDDAAKWDLILQCYDDPNWRDVLMHSSVEAVAGFEIDAGSFWVNQANHPDANGILTRRILDRMTPQTLSPSLVVLVGTAKELKDRLQPFVAAIVTIDDRPVVSGHLPDFWQSNIARIVTCCLQNPNIRAITLVRNDATTVKRTRDILLGACRSDANVVAGAQIPQWSPDEISKFAAATALVEPWLREFTARRITLNETTPTLAEVRQSLLNVYASDPRELSARGIVVETVTRNVGSTENQGSQELKYEFRGTGIKTVYPAVIQAIRSVGAPRYDESETSQLTELTGVRIELTAPQRDELPDYWRLDANEFAEYYRRAFDGNESLFGKRFHRWGGPANTTDQFERVVDGCVSAILQKRIERRLLLVIAQPPGTDAGDPLGLVSAHALPRKRIGTATWNIDFLWVWRSVEAIVGFPFSLYGSVQYSYEILSKVNSKLPPNSVAAAMGSVTYLPISLHLFRHETDLAIARHIDLNARP